MALIKPVREVIVCTYTRLSNDPNGVRIEHETQDRVIHKLLTAERLPMPLPEHQFRDTDRSASKDDVYRPDWERLLDFLAKVDATRYEVVLVGYAQDRTMRLLGDPAMLANLLERKRGRLYWGLSGRVPVEKGARTVMYILGAVAADEAEKIAMRTSGGMETAAINGAPHSRAPFGYVREYDSLRNARQVIDPDAAQVVKEMAERILAGDSLRQIANDLNERKVKAPGMGLHRRDPETRAIVGTVETGWTATTVRKVITRKSLIGIRVHRAGKGEAQTVTEYPGNWPAILDEDTYSRVCAVFENPDRRSTTHNTLTHLLSMIARCGVCDGKVWSNPAPRGKGARPMYRIYRCEKGHVVKRQDYVDAVVTESVLDLFSQANVVELLGADETQAATESRHHEAGLLARRAELVATLSVPGMPVADITRAIRTLDEELASVRKRAAADINAPAYLALALAEDTQAFWEAMGIQRQRAVISAALRVTLWPSPKRGKGAFDPTSIDIQLRHEEGAEA